MSLYATIILPTQNNVYKDTEIGYWLQVMPITYNKNNTFKQILFFIFIYSRWYYETHANIIRRSWQSYYVLRTYINNEYFQTYRTKYNQQLWQTKSHSRHLCSLVYRWHLCSKHRESKTNLRYVWISARTLRSCISCKGWQQFNERSTKITG